MSIIQIDIIDIISNTPNGKVMLTISDHLPWDKKNEHLLLLQEKLNKYLQFIESGEIFESYPAAKNQKIIISLSMQYEPNQDTLIFLNRCKEVISNAGIDFEWETFFPANL